MHAKSMSQPWLPAAANQSLAPPPTSSAARPPDHVLKGAFGPFVRSSFPFEIQHEIGSAILQLPSDGKFQNILSHYPSLGAASIDLSLNQTEETVKLFRSTVGYSLTIGAFIWGWECESDGLVGSGPFIDLTSSWPRMHYGGGGPVKIKLSGLKALNDRIVANKMKQAGHVHTDNGGGKKKGKSGFGFLSVVAMRKLAVEEVIANLYKAVIEDLRPPPSEGRTPAKDVESDQHASTAADTKKPEDESKSSEKVQQERTEIARGEKSTEPTTCTAPTAIPTDSSTTTAAATTNSGTSSSITAVEDGQKSSPEGNEPSSEVRNDTNDSVVASKATVDPVPAAEALVPSAGTLSESDSASTTAATSTSNTVIAPPSIAPHPSSSSSSSKTTAASSSLIVSDPSSTQKDPAQLEREAWLARVTAHIKTLIPPPDLAPRFIPKPPADLRSTSTLIPPKSNAVGTTVGTVDEKQRPWYQCLWTTPVIPRKTTTMVGANTTTSTTTSPKCIGPPAPPAQILADACALFKEAVRATSSSSSDGIIRAGNDSGEDGKTEKAATTEDDDEIEVGDQTLLFACPLGLTKIVHPVKGKRCKHGQCFDGM
ncbi:hypothetical protein HK102_011737, partial [Quaeritorhiza haematococci]